jgi:hypothetical protein
MIRKQVYIEARQEEALKRKARELSLTEADLIRRGIDDLDNPRTQTVGDREAWTAAMRIMSRRAARAEPLAKPPRDRGWTREELYDERPKYLAR